MERSISSTLQNLVHDTFKCVKQWMRKLNKRTNVPDRSTIVIVAAACGLFIACAQILPALTQRVVPLIPETTQQSPVAQPPVYDAPQTNPLFATNPTWSQNFADQTSGVPDPRYWNVLVGPAENSNKEQQYYTDNLTNLRVEGGALRFIATHGAQPEGYTYGSARIETQGKQSFLYGRIDITAKLPKGVGSWPAVWMLPANNIYAEKSPEGTALRYKNGGEMDILEAVGFEPDVVYGVAHSASDLTIRADGTGSHGTAKVPNSTKSFNTYSVLWTPTSVTFAVNDMPYFNYVRKDGADYTTWPFDQPFYLIANLAMGGTWGGMDTSIFKNGIDNSALPSSLDIRSIYYYPYIGSTVVE
jgi:beta-glucanase (GH16 family)